MRLTFSFECTFPSRREAMEWLCIYRKRKVSGNVLKTVHAQIISEKWMLLYILAMQPTSLKRLIPLRHFTLQSLMSVHWGFTLQCFILQYNELDNILILLQAYLTTFMSLVPPETSPNIFIPHFRNIFISRYGFVVTLLMMVSLIHVPVTIGTQDLYMIEPHLPMKSEWLWFMLGILISLHGYQCFGLRSQDSHAPTVWVSHISWTAYELSKTNAGKSSYQVATSYYMISPV